MRGMMARYIFQANKHKLTHSGHTLESLADLYENDYSITKNDLLRIINSKIPHSDEPISLRWLNRHLDPLLTKERKGSVSREEANFRSKLVSWFPKQTAHMETSNRQLIAPLEVDMYLPDQKLAIEFNGDYWHSDRFLLENHGMTAEEYHTEKQTQLAKLGITTLFIWESDWQEQPRVIKQALTDWFTRHSISPILSKLEYELDDDLDY